MIPTISTWLLHKELGEKKLKFDDALKLCAQELGAVSIEIPRTTYGDWSMSGVRELKRRLHHHGLYCAAIAAQNHFNCPTHAERRREVALTKDFIDIAQFVGCRVLNIFHAGWGDREQGRRLKAEMLDCLRDCVHYAEEKGVLLAVEAHGPLTDNVAEFREFFDSCPSEYLRINLDTGNMYEGPEGNLKLLEYTAHVHVKPTYKDLDGQVKDAEAARVLKALKGTGYRGTVTMEHVDGDPVKNLPGAFAEFKKLLAGL
ncbi:MAG: sugar phosphate isomerase/epimerase [Planctomycetota bacterium]|nr:sugar phosphate isomerase/epimerase [Planctomycetota bacterium]